MAPPPPPAVQLYPVMAARTVPSLQPKLSRRRLWIVMAVVIGVVAIAVTAIAVAIRPTVQACGFYCGPHLGPPLINPTVYTNSKFNVTIEYPRALGVAGQDDSGVRFTPLSADGSAVDGEISFTITTGGNVDTAVTDAVGSLSTASFQDMVEIGPVRGAEIGLVAGRGVAYSAIHVPAGGGQATKVSVVVIAATQGNITVVSTMFSDQTQDPAAAPYGLVLGEVYDFPVTNTHFPGS
jgi:hypothetical protein